jgi:hypothetical protein
MLLIDTIQINTSPDKIFDWFQKLDKHFTEWHVNHKKLIKLTGGLDVGDVIHFEELIDGKWFKFNVKITRKEKTPGGFLIEAKMPPFATLLFTAQANENGCLFTHSETFGFIKNESPFVRSYITPLLRSIFNPIYRFDLIEKDIKEDNINLKRILESS